MLCATRRQNRRECRIDISAGCSRTRRLTCPMGAHNRPPDGISFHETASVLIWRPEGIIDEAAVNQVIAYLGDLEMRREKPFNRFIDTGQAEAIDLNFRYIFHVSLYRRLSYQGPDVLTAILASEDVIARYFKMHALLTQGSSIEARLFKTRALAAEWLGVPVALLEE